ncbi:MAG: proprotein convertase P-domain-containing protein [Oligoflexales bacterium]
MFNTRLFVAMFVAIALPCYADFLPPNDLAREDHLFESEGRISEEQYNGILDLIETTYSSLIKENFNATLVFERNWQSAIVNAYASRENDTWKIWAHGGMARRPELSTDGYTLVMCHELGHHLGGYPFKGETWAASEGQADYFATKECLRRVWANQIEQNAQQAESVDPVAKERCDAGWPEGNERNLCYRIVMAGKSSALLSSILSQEPTPEFGTPDLSQIETTEIIHPKAQCRLDTYLSSATCRQPSSNVLIPGLNNAFGKNTKEAEIESAQVTCMQAAPFADGFRPRCWFKPLNTLLIDVQPATFGANDNGPSVNPGTSFRVTTPLKNIGTEAVRLSKTAVNSLDPHLIVTPREHGPLDLAPLAKANISEEFQIAEDAACGSRLDYEVVMNTETASERFARSIRIGKITQSAGYDKANQILIKRSETTSDKVQVIAPGPYDLVFVRLDILIYDATTIDVKIKSPAGNIYPLHNQEPGFDILKTYDFLAVPGEVFEGGWELIATSHSHVLAGILNSWQLSFFDASCE